MKISADFKKRVLAREWLAGSFVNLGSSVTVELTGNLGNFQVLDVLERVSDGREGFFDGIQYGIGFGGHLNFPSSG